VDCPSGKIAARVRRVLRLGSLKNAVSLWSPYLLRQKLLVFFRSFILCSLQTVRSLTRLVENIYERLYERETKGSRRYLQDGLRAVT
jgi:hypothetical protein